MAYSRSFFEPLGTWIIHQSPAWSKTHTLARCQSLSQAKWLCSLAAFRGLLSWHSSGWRFSLCRASSVFVANLFCLPFWIDGPLVDFHLYWWLRAMFPWSDGWFYRLRIQWFGHPLGTMARPTWSSFWSERAILRLIHRGMAVSPELAIILRSGW